jgi:hypothetical protein
MSDGVALPLLALTATLIIALALVWPQGQGRRSPGPFGHALAPLPVSLPTPKGPILLRGPEPPAKPTARP